MTILVNKSERMIYWLTISTISVIKSAL